MSLVFNELLSSDAFFPFREAHDEVVDGPGILCENAYLFVPALSGGGYDILLNTTIFRQNNRIGLQDNKSPGQREILASGSNHFTFNGKHFVPAGSYYDYRVIAQRVCDDR